MEEKNFFNQNGVSVSNARFIAHGQTYAMSGITSVKSFRQDPSRLLPILLSVIGLIVQFAGAPAFGIFIIAAAIIVWVRAKPEFSVLLNSASGEAKALASSDGIFISNVVNALNESIVHRG